MRLMDTLRYCALGMAVLTLGVADAIAQTPAKSFAELQPRIKVGQRLLITNDKGVANQGKVVSIAGNQLEIKQGGTWLSKEKRLVFTEDAVRRIEHPDGTWDGAIIGGAIGLALGVWVAHSPNPDEGNEAAIALFPWAGAYVGEWFDGRHRRLLYLSPQAGRGGRTAVVPLLGRRRVGIVASIRF